MVDGEDLVAVNRAHWDERVPIHVAGDFYDVERFLHGGSTLRRFELDEIGDVGVNSRRPSLLNKAGSKPFTPIRERACL